ncbi:hypothetical protein DFH06DRAFT_1351790 [Mycena polygramma]|nr:hypothetical protein DFH06DRAFT_1351790 [Mycena polygramma]
MNLGMNLAHMLQVQLIVAIVERARHTAAWKGLDINIPEERKSEWQARIDAFHADERQPSPYLLSGMHEALFVEWARAKAEKARWEEESTHPESPPATIIRNMRPWTSALRCGSRQRKLATALNLPPPPPSASEKRRLQALVQQYKEEDDAQVQVQARVGTDLAKSPDIMGYVRAGPDDMRTKADTRTFTWNVPLGKWQAMNKGRFEPRPEDRKTYDDWVKKLQLF